MANHLRNGNPILAEGETVLCRLCGSECFELLFTKEEFRIEKCATCGLWQVTNVLQNSRIEDSDKKFFDYFYQGLLGNSRRSKRWDLKFLPLGKAGETTYEYEKYHFRLEEIESKTTKIGKILDVGCGCGFFLDAANQRGWETYGIEPSQYASNYAQQKLGLRVVDKPLLEANFENDYFDLITMWNVLERLRHPRQAFSHILKMLKRDGLLVFNFSNVESYIVKLQGKHWRIFSPPGMLTYFSSKTIGLLLKSCNFELVEEITALPREKMFKELGLLKFLRKLRVSDKVRAYARKNSTFYQ